MWRKAAIGLVGALTLTASNADAQANDKIAVHLNSTTDDAAGRKLAFRVRDLIGRSGLFSEVGEDHDRGFSVRLVTLDPFNNTSASGRSTVYSLVVLIKNDEGLDYFLSSYVGTCGPDTLAGCAEDIFNALGENSELVRQVLANQ